MNVDTKIVEQLTTKYFSQLTCVTIDIDIIDRQKYNIDQVELENIFKHLSENISFFKTKLNYPLQLSNLFFFAVDALGYEEETNWRGSVLRNNITREYRDILNKLKK